jgi:hypothetical protein
VQNLLPGTLGCIVLARHFSIEWTDVLLEVNALASDAFSGFLFVDWAEEYLGSLLL